MQQMNGRVGTKLKYKSGFTALSDQFGNRRVSDLKKAGIDTDSLTAGQTVQDINQVLSNMSFEEQAESLTKWQQALKQAMDNGKDVKDTYDEVTTALEELKEQQDNATTAAQNYKDALGELSASSGSVYEYETALSKINETYGKNENVSKMVSELQSLNKQYTEGTIDSTKYYNSLQEKIKSIDVTKMTGYFSEYKDQISKLKKEQSDYWESVTETQDKIVDGQRETTYSFTESADTIQSKMDGYKSQIDELQNKIDNFDISGLSEEEQQEIEGMEAIIAETSSYIAQSLTDLTNAYAEGEISYKDYFTGQEEAAQTTIDVYAKIHNLTYDQEQGWVDASGAVDEYANSIQDLQDDMESFNGIIGLLQDNYAYLKKNVDEFGNAAFNAEAVQTEAYQNLATSFAASLAQMKTSNEEAYQAIVNSAVTALGQTATEASYADEYVLEMLQKNNGSLNAALNEASRQSQEASNKMATATGDLMTTIGETIEHFDYNVTGSLDGFKTEDKDLGPFGTVPVPVGLKFKIEGGAGEGSSPAALGAALKQWAADYKDYTASNNTYKSLIDIATPVYKGGGSTGKTTTPKDDPVDTGKTGKTGNTGSTSSSSSKSDEEKAEEEAYKNRLSAFKEYVKEKERLEKRWVDKQKDLGLLSNDDYLYIIQQRIKRYEEYLQAVKDATWMNEEDKLELEQDYMEEIEDLQVDYFDYLKDKLDDEIDALKDANDEKIDLIEEEADARIAALEKVEDENDRIRSKEEYEKKRQEYLDDISYWEQRTGREAQENLLEARKNLAELDEEWNQTLEDWSIEDQKQAIEDERDAQIQAIEDEQEKQIAAWQAAYDEKVKMFAETGEIIYEGSEMQSKALYDQYMKNFVTPIKSELADLNKSNAESTTKTTTTTSNTQASTTKEPEYETYIIQWGDTMTSIAKKYGTTIDKIMAANPYVTNKNKIYAGKTLQIPKFHQGGKVGGTEEGFALLKPGEVVLKTEWANSMEKMMKYFDDISSGKNTTNITNGPTIEVKGDLVKVEANIKSQTDADYLTKKIEKTLKDKFNIKK